MTEAGVGVTAGAPGGRIGEEGCLPRNFQGSLTLPTLRFGPSSLQNSETIDYSCLEPPSLWEFVKAALGK